MDLDSTLKISDIISGISLLITIVGGFFALYQWRRNIALKRASYINDLTEKIRTDPDIHGIVYLLDYNQEWYNAEFHESGEQERKVDKTLSFFSYICYLKKHRLIGRKDFNFFKYEIERILMNSGVQDYLYNLYHYSNKYDLPLTFFFLFKYGKKHKYFDSDFYCPTAYLRTNKYSHNLNF
ncbi:MAG: hypothetical protein IKS66_06300 [Oscillospiraceae bacterium]|nr:hypothetical protein [Oscillospiraceae bacterium]